MNFHALRMTALISVAFVVAILAGGLLGFSNTKCEVSYDGDTKIITKYLKPKTPPQELPSPNDWLNNEHLRLQYNSETDEYRFTVTSDRPISRATYADTNSMDSTFDTGTTGIYFQPKTEDEIYIGDVVSYESEWAPGKLIAHRIIDKSQDDLGTYYIIQGDNLYGPDPGKIRFKQIKYVLVGLLY